MTLRRSILVLCACRPATLGPFLSTCGESPFSLLPNILCGRGDLARTGTP